MSKHRKEGGHPPTATLPVRSKVVATIVAGGAFAAVGQPMVANAASELDQPAPRLTGSKNLSLAVTGTTRSPAAVRLLAAEQSRIDSAEEIEKIDKSEAIEQAREAARAEAERAEQAERAAAETAKRAEEERKRKARSFVKPAEGTFTSGFGARWGTSHRGVDIANSIGTPIRSVAAGKVIEAGPASGFGLWIRVQHDDGTITVYGHINTIDVSVGERVDAGDKIATMGNRGQSTGPHLHFEVHVNGTKINPLPWLEARGISL
ncbi:M23 family metallopeptidase [Saccharopolyspora shandongensis]|uniref:M23 family metallopeptidase n=1 Tax=Saccharopolyspora shandongensis TaxID=418495 RepID=UPI003400F43D